ncbi:uncharacterized protein HKW66_Vig0014100 [Vigna angularis]|uniref:DUF4408 domain-containing protein n=3 Tax=Phaseolus angularis TaxID=3914 RepID=A0A8T0LJA6_PHAAN|nr:uncharacterized protein LOC108339303 [Vigna angularis]KAG2410745.1 uncharacterized protein HKW66_Vig0014100 [Vigna angularis]BAT73127.1 hypothetical protein VIGAN_01058700 [Vigna angularis var. angularis]
MDPTQMKKIQAMKRYKSHQFLNNLYVYFVSALTCSVFCFVTFCMPYLSSLLRLFFFVHISSLVPVLFSSKLLFIMGNLIIFFLVVNSRILSSDPSSTPVVYYDEYIRSSQTPKPLVATVEVKRGKTLEKHVVGEILDIDSVDFKCKGRVEKGTETFKEDDDIDAGDEQRLIPSCSDELNKRADDFIARVNRQRRLELSLLNYGGSY